MACSGCLTGSCGGSCGRAAPAARAPIRYGDSVYGTAMMLRAARVGRGYVHSPLPPAAPARPADQSAVAPPPEPESVSTPAPNLYHPEAYVALAAPSRPAGQAAAAAPPPRTALGTALAVGVGVAGGVLVGRLLWKPKRRAA